MTSHSETWAEGYCILLERVWDRMATGFDVVYREGPKQRAAAKLMLRLLKTQQYLYKRAVRADAEAVARYAMTHRWAEATTWPHTGVSVRDIYWLMFTVRGWEFLPVDDDTPQFAAHDLAMQVQLPVPEQMTLVGTN